jgi:hypothetical protein
MLESEGRLRTWELEAVPVDGVKVRAVALPDHRLHYLDYEGPLSEDRGTVRRWDSGIYLLLSEFEDQLECELSGERLQGRLQLSRHSLNRGHGWAHFDAR